MFIGVYDTSAEDFGRARFFDVGIEPPDRGLPTTTKSLGDILNEISQTFRVRNKM